MNSNKRLNNKELSTFCSQIALILNAGITPVEGLQILLSDTKDTAGGEIIASLLSICQQGESFHAAAKKADVFPNYVLSMIALGEESGRLDEVMASLSSYYEREENIAAGIKSAISYPFIMIGMMLLVIVVLLTKVLPIFNQVFIQLGSEMSGISKTLMNLGSSMSRYSIAIIAFLVLCIILFFYFTKTVHGKQTFQKLLSHLPLAKSFYSNVASGRFASGIALTLSSGLDTYQSLDLVSELVDNKEMKNKILHCKQLIADGLSFSDALVSANIFSNLYSKMVAVGFKTGSIDTVMFKIATNYERETDEKISSIISILEPTLVIILSLIVGLILLSVIMPLMGIMSSIG